MKTQEEKMKKKKKLQYIVNNYQVPAKLMYTLKHIVSYTKRFTIENA